MRRGSTGTKLINTQQSGSTIGRKQEQERSNSNEQNAVVTESSRAEVLDEDLLFLRDYDYFENERKAHLLKLKNEKQVRDHEARGAKKDKALQWRTTGSQAMNALSTRLAKFNSIIGPHQMKKECLAELLLYHRQAVSVENGYSSCHCRWHAKRLVAQIKPKQVKWKSKVNLLDWKFAVNREILASYYRRHPFNFDYRHTSKALRTLRHLFRIYTQFIPLEKAVLTTLYKKREKEKAALKKLQVVKDTMKACEFISVCKSVQHFNPKGCTNCGVIYHGGMMDGIQYVKSISRDTGVATLVTLDFEKDTLRREEVMQRRIVDDVQDDLKKCEDALYGTVRSSLQAWLCFVLAFKRYRKLENKMIKSRQRYRIRRLVTLKREVDALIIEPEPLDYQYMCNKYFDVYDEMVEYTTLQTELKRQRILKIAKRFHGNLKDVVELGREKRRLEEIERNKKKPKPIHIRKIKNDPSPKLICYREGCKLRNFLTEDRYKTHMSIHFKEDNIRYRKYQEQKIMKMIRREEENRFMDRVTASRLFLTADKDCEVTDAIIRNLEALLQVEKEIYGQLNETSRKEELFKDVHVSNVEVYCQDSLAGADSIETDVQTVKSDLMSIFTTHLKEFQSSNDIRASSSNPNLSFGNADNDMRKISSSFGSNKLNVFNLSKAIEKDLNISAASSLVGLPKINKNSFRTEFNRSHTGNDTVATSTTVFDNISNEQDGNEDSLSLPRLAWASMTHLYALNSAFNSPLFFLEMISKHGDIDVASKILLQSAVLRIGTHQSCEIVVHCTGAAKWEERIAKVHCLIYNPMGNQSDAIPGKRRNRRVEKFDSDSEYSNVHTEVSAIDEGTEDHSTNSTLTVVDNKTSWGTYVVSSSGTKKVPSKVTSGTVLTPGLLLCIGVRKDGPENLTATEANEACVVYRVRCQELENKSN